MTDRPYAEVIGDPIAHSKSPMIHRFWLEGAGIDADYHKVQVRPDELGAYLRCQRDDPAWRGCNVTVPHKVAVLDHVDDPGTLRASIGAANTITRKGAALVAANTDAGGFHAPIAHLDLTGKPVTVIGAGGAARAILFALAGMAVGPITILNRTPATAESLLAELGLDGEALPMSARVPPSALLVNASSLGMTGQPPLTVDLAPLPADAVVYDAVYAPLETALLAQARARGLRTIDGLEMLVAQAALAFEAFFGVAPPRDRDADLRAMLVA